MNRPKKMNKTQSYYFGLHDGIVGFIHENNCSYFKMKKNGEKLAKFLKGYNEEQTHLKRPPLKRDGDFFEIFLGQLKYELEKERNYNENSFVKFAENFGVEYFLHTPFSDAIIKALSFY